MILNGDMSAGICDESRILQNAGGHGNRAAARTEHHGNKLLRYEQAICLNSVMAHQEPPGQALVNLMYAVARGGLGGLHEQAMHAPQQARP